MITQEYTQGTNKIKVETAENLEDAEKNNFVKGQYSRFFVNGKKVDNYMAMIRFVVDEARENKENLVPSGQKIEEIRQEMFKKQQELINNQLKNIKEQYKQMNIPPETLEMVLDKIKKLDPVTNMRVVE